MEIAMAVLLSLAVLITVAVYFSFFPLKMKISPSFIAGVGVFGAMAAILYTVPIFTIKLPVLFPSFLTLHFDEIPCFITGFAYGPFSAFLSILIKTIVKLPLTKTAYVGELVDLLLSSAYVIPASIIYRKMRTYKGYAIGMGAATISQLAVAVLSNVFLLIPFYVQLYFNGDAAGLLSLIQKTIPAIKDLKWSYALLGVLPFNLLKDAVVIVVSTIIFRALKRIIDKRIAA